MKSQEEEEETFTNTRGPTDTDTKYKNVDIIYFVCDIIWCYCDCMSGVGSNEKGRGQRVITSKLIIISFWRHCM